MNYLIDFYYLIGLNRLRRSSMELSSLSDWLCFHRGMRQV